MVEGLTYIEGSHLNRLHVSSLFSCLVRTTHPAHTRRGVEQWQLSLIHI